MPWEDLELAVDEDELIERILTGIADRLDGWEPNEGAPEVALAEEIGRETAETNALVIEAGQLALAGIGETVFGLTARTAAYAVIPDVAINLRVVYQLQNTQVYPPTIDRDVAIPAGFTIVADGVAFQTTADITGTVTMTTIAGKFYTATVHTPMTAITPGTVGNVPADTPVTIITSARDVASAVIAEDADGGVDEESLTDYLSRLTDYLSTLRPGGVLAADLVTLARTVPGVYRALAIDLYDPATPNVPQERTVTIIALDAAGEAVDGSTATELAATLEAVREVNFRIVLAPPKHTLVDVEAEVVAVPGADHATVEAAVRAAILALIDPASWGTTPGDPRSWVERTVLRPLDLAIAASQVPGVATVTSTTVHDSEGITTLDGPGALPAAVGPDVTDSKITVVVT
ncbi:baseplate J/gp47 family protein [Nocardioides lianchengensis]|uniref:Baseplate J-like protein n=1 Tax=Nocardioides lianchengensis TaxID=1045774 RepID=A0A1G6LTE0_9ACTN|nr:baseplate J/gp47 family protein [Nocardioides lianchengensis]NYG12449.1 hypothetical protein [Nocardioides lianchengensis]SDC46513.1 Baseplate J-like protein [Nocardioides lianchengensis]